MVILVTGASGGIGQEVCRQLAGEGHQIAVHYHRSKKRAEHLAQEVGGMALGADVSDKSDVGRMVKAILRKWHRLDALVNSAGFPIRRETWSYWTCPFEKTTSKMFRDVFEVDTLGTINCIQAVLPSMKKNRFGKIINFVSTPALSGHTKGYSFTSAKGAVLSLTKGLAIEVAPMGIAVNAIAPCTIATSWFHYYPPALKKKIARDIPMRRVGSPKDIAPLVCYLVSHGSDWVTGKVFIVDGGETRL